MSITIQRVEHKKGTKGYKEFIDSLQIAYNLRDIDAGDLEWVDIKQTEFGEPKVLVHIQEDHPDLSVILRPENADSQQITNEHETYKTPLLLVGVRRWGESDLALHNYKIDRWSGRPAKDMMFQQSRSLTEIVGMDLAEVIKESTPVVEVVSFLPMAENAEFTTQFTPYLSFEILGHQHYKVSTISQNSLSVYLTLSQGSNISVKDIDENKQMYNWMAQSFPGLSEIEQKMEPSSHGHMILIATPVEKPKPKFDIRYLGFDSEQYGGGFLKGLGPSTYRGEGITRSASISSAKISRGAESGQGYTFEGEVSNSKNGNSIIYHIQFLCITPQEAKHLHSNGLGAIGKIMHNYQKN